MGSLYLLTNRLIRLGGPMWLYHPSVLAMEMLILEWWPIRELPAPTA